MASQQEHELPLCSAYIRAKGRSCRFPVAPGSEYCYSHRTEIGTQRRVPCPLDPRHFVHEAQLKRHLGKCPARAFEEQTANLPFFARSCNAPPTTEEQEASIHLNSLTEEDLAHWERLIDAALETALARLFPETICKNACEQTLSKLLQHAVAKDIVVDVPDWLHRVRRRIETDGTPADGKHSLQSEQLLARCVEAGLLADPMRTCFLEYGSGKGRLSRWFALAAEEQGYGCPSFVLVERGAQRIKAENRMDVRGAADRVLRLRMDLVDFDLPALLQALPPKCARCIPDLQENDSLSSPMDVATVADGVGMPAENERQLSKERLSEIRGISSRANDSRLPGERLQNIHCVADALRSGNDWPPSLTVVCAKHLCGAGTDLALRSLARAVGDPIKHSDTSRLDFAVVLAPCCHHLCEWRLYVNQAFLEEMFSNAREAFAVLLAMSPWATDAKCNKLDVDQLAGSRRERRRLLGVKAKRLLDAGRALWLHESLRFQTVDLSIYTDASVSPENLLLLARRQACL